MTDLADFLLARIAEDEVVARNWPEDRLPPPNGDVLWVDPLGHSIYQPRSRVLAECEAKRRVRSMQIADEVDRILAAVYADHPDYREEWRP